MKNKKQKTVTALWDITTAFNPTLSILRNGPKQMQQGFQLLEEVQKDSKRQKKGKRKSN